MLYILNVVRVNATSLIYRYVTLWDMLFTFYVQWLMNDNT